MSLTIAQKIKVYKHFSEKGALLIFDKQHESNKILNINNKKLRSFIQSLKDRGYVKEYYVWQQAYILATNSGMEFFDEETRIPDKLDEGIKIEEMHLKAE
ncbi:hypothetical protein NAPIS_ORF01271 [Vairimorpha apis BRL 01]|uniref:Plectin/eS10 N-terminal domain-containing protein n=1 Tax=Vairimorpha apis BRL 01 TaxID=1037528 RepID=T0MJP2_9MICR|nr:hypothetical protein NAPIS_ORF01271 [Vairimorpha apis BRL 01]